jgi:hypothetical protein
MNKLFTALFVLFLVTIASAADEWHIETVGSSDGTNSLALDSSGYPHIAYCDAGDIKYASWDGETWLIETVWPGISSCTSLALDSDDFPHISFQGVDHYCYYACRDGDEWQIQFVYGTIGPSGEFSSLAVDSSDLPCISCYGEDWELLYARWDGDEWIRWDVDWEGGGIGFYNSLALDSSDYPHISYCAGEYELRYARWDGDEWLIEPLESEEGVFKYSSLALDSNDYPHCSYYEGLFEVVKYVYWDGDEWQITPVDSGCDPSLALDSNDYPHISFQGGGCLRYARGDGGGWQIETVDSDGEVGAYSSLVLDSYDNPHISYYDATNGDLKYAWYGDDSAVEDVELAAEAHDEGVLVGWTVTGDVPAGLRVLRGDAEPTYISGLMPGPSARYLDRGVEPGGSYVYWLEVTEADGTLERFGPTEAVTVPEEAFTLLLDAVYPSPARDAVNFAYSIPEDSHVVLTVYDLSGRRIATQVDADQAAGRHEVSWNCGNIPSGVYLYRLETNTGSLTKRLVVSR